VAGTGGALVSQLVVLAGGLGTRLRDTLPPGLPKALAPVAGRPFVELLLDHALARGVDHVVMLAGHGADALRRHLGDRYRGVPVVHSVEPSPLGTGGALRHAGSLLHDAFVLVNGDTFVDLDPGALLDDGPLSLTVAHVDSTARFGGVVVGDDGRVVRFTEKGTSGPGLINAGAYGCRRILLDLFPDEAAFSFETDFLEPRLASLRPRAVEAAGAFFDIGVPTDHRAAHRHFAEPGSGTTPVGAPS
jgi:D-glycero-alpha-D-manno-heptose 1-phosphate guanylyltransferase